MWITRGEQFRCVVDVDVNTAVAQGRADGALVGRWRVASGARVRIPAITHLATLMKAELREWKDEGHW